MQLTLIIFLAVSLFEACLWLPFIWRQRRGFAAISASLVVVWTVLASWELRNVWVALIAVISLYRCINLARVFKNRIQPDYLFRASRRSALYFIAAQAVLLAVSWLTAHHNVSALVVWYAIAGSQLLGALVIAAATVKQSRAIRVPGLSKTVAHRDLPSLTVAIPARNETDDLEACLASLLKNDYPKLEIIVLDDCSQNKRTPEIIRSMAHDGVRFIAGSAPPAKWLAKNYAYAQLADEASGELLLFCGVDTRFTSDSLVNLVRTLLQTDKAMFSILPRNALPALQSMEPLLIQPARYAWELALPRDWSRRPPVLSTCWLIRKQKLQDVGGFKAFTRSSLPERHLARLCSSLPGQPSQYRFFQTNDILGVNTVKTVAEQQATAIRMRYPQLHRRPYLVALTTLSEFALFLMPPAMALAAALTHYWLLAGLGAGTYAIFMAIYAYYVKLTYQRFLWRGLIAFPLAAIYDIGLLNYSMWQYEFNQVIWKARNVCIPVMRVVAALPKV